MSTTGTGPAAAPLPPASSFTPAQAQHWELGVSLVLHGWQALTDAVACGWGGPDSSDKRDWLCGAVADMFVERPETDEYDVEETLVNVMEDEFEVNLEDDSAFEVGKRVIALRRMIADGNFKEVQEWHARFLERQKNRDGTATLPKVVDQQGEEEEDGGSADEESETGEDVEMSEAPAPAPSRPREQRSPILDEDGFEQVRRRRR